MATRKTTKTAEAAGVTLDEQPTALATQPESAGLAQYDASDLGVGFEDVDSADLKVPLLYVLQSNNPQVQPGNPKHVPGAQPSMFMNNLTGELFDGQKGLLFIPVRRIRTFFEYVPRDKGGGLVGRHDPNDPAVQRARKGHEFGRIPFGEGTELTESFNVYSLIVDEKTGETWPIIIPFQSTAIGAYQTFYSIAYNQRVEVPGRGKVPLPLYAHLWRIRTKFRQNQKGAWYAIEIVPAVDNDVVKSRLAKDDPRFEAAKAFERMIAAGRVKDTFDDATAQDVGGDPDDVKDI